MTRRLPEALHYRGPVLVDPARGQEGHDLSAVAASEYRQWRDARIVAQESEAEQATRWFARFAIWLAVFAFAPGALWLAAQLIGGAL